MVLRFLFLVSSVLAGYPVPTPPNGRVEVHGWLILPLDQNAPTDDQPILGWFSHHTPQIYHGDNSTKVLPPLEFPHDWQIIFLGSLRPVSIGDSMPVVPIPLNYPPKAPLLVDEFTITPPPAFSLNNLLNGDIKWLAGSVYNGSFDTTYDRVPTNIGNVTVEQLTTAVWLNESAAPFPTLQYLSYPRQLKPAEKATEVHIYMAHQIHAPPDFDQVIHVVVDPTRCSGSDRALELLTTPGAAWQFPGTVNDISHRLMPSAKSSIGVLLGSKLTCSFTILEQIHCVPGPDFGARCDDVHA